MKFDEIKKLTAWEILKLLQKKTRKNANLIKENSQIIQSVLKGEIALESGRFNIAEVQDKNNELIKENSEYLKLHNQLLSFMRGVQQTDDVPYLENEQEDAVAKDSIPENKIETEDELFEKTILGQIEFNAKHPFFKSVEFKNRLLSYYTEREEYERCAVLVNM